jgi:hypothetical protein
LVLAIVEKHSFGKKEQRTCCQLGRMCESRKNQQTINKNAASLFLFIHKNFGLKVRVFLQADSDHLKTVYCCFVCKKNIDKSFMLKLFVVEITL